MAVIPVQTDTPAFAALPEPKMKPEEVASGTLDSIEAEGRMKCSQEHSPAAQPSGSRRTLPPYTPHGRHPRRAPIMIGVIMIVLISDVIINVKPGERESDRADAACERVPNRSASTPQYEK